MIFKNSPVKANFTVLNIRPPKTKVLFEVLLPEVIFKSDFDHIFELIDPTFTQLPSIRFDLSHHLDS